MRRSRSNSRNNTLAWLISLSGYMALAAGRLTADSPLPALPSELSRALESITSDRIMRHVDQLCDSTLAGRDAGTAGARAAADYLADQFRAIGLRPGGSAGSYFQTFKIRRGYRINGELSLRFLGDRDDGEVLELKRGQDYMPIHLPRDQASVASECVLVGYGITSRVLGFDEYRDVDVNGRAVLAFSGVPWTAETGAWIRGLEAQSLGTLTYKARNAAAHGAALMLVVDDPSGWRQQLEVSEQLRLPDREFPLNCEIPVVHVTRSFASKLVGMSTDELRMLAMDIRADRQPDSMALRGRVVGYSATITGSARIGRNVIGVLPGSDSLLREQSVVVGAHYDHLGEGVEGIYFGANDNASGVSAMLEVARAMTSLAERPRRTTIFIAFAAEEIGKLGSYHYVANPTMPIERTVLMINFDMVGRNEADEILAVGTRSSEQLHQLHHDMNRHVGLKITNPQSFRLGRSDHTGFYYAKVPIMYLFGGLHLGYHTPEDTVDKLIPEKIEKAARLAFLTAENAASRNERLAFQENEER